ncbi:MAG: cupin domain-containing protein [Anaerolineae bacterium]
MIKLRLADLPDVREGHFLGGLVPGRYLSLGGLSFKPAGFRTHSHEGPGGADRHVHADDHEVFVLLQGKASMEIDGVTHPLVTGDILIVEPGEDHHLVADMEDPCINLWLHAGPERHPDQRPKGDDQP